MGSSQVAHPADHRQPTDSADQDSPAAERTGRSGTAGPAAGSPGRVRALLLELAFAVVGGIVISAALQAVLARAHIIPGNTYMPTALSTLAVGSTVLLLVVLVVRGPVRRHFDLTVPALLATITTLALALPLLGTRFYFGGLSVDQEFRTQYVTRLTSSPALADMNYAHLASFYPAGWFWLAGRFAALTGLPGWAAYKPFAIGSMAVMGAVGFVLWKQVLPRRQAALAALATALVGVIAGAEEPYAWIGAGAFAPVAIAAWHLLRCNRHRHRAGLIGLGVFLGISALTYTLYCGFFGFVVATIAGIAVVEQIRSGVRWTSALWTVVRRLLPVGITAGALALVFWGQYFVAVLHAAGRSGVAQRYLPPDSAVLPTPMLQASAFGVLCLAGTIWLLTSFRSSQIAAPLGLTAVLVYVWFGLSTVALFAHTTLLAFRLNVVLLTVLAPAGVLGALELYRRLRTRVAAEHGPRLHALAFGVVVIGAVAIAQTVPEAHAGALDRSAGDYYPSGVNARGQSDPKEPGAWNGKLQDTIAQLSGKRPTELTVLSTYTTLMTYQPYWGFQQNTPHYANPLADYPRRAAEIADWTTATSYPDLLHKLDHEVDQPPNVFVLQHKSDGLHMTLQTDIFPAYPNVFSHDVVFKPSLFQGPEFVTRDVGPYTVIVRR